MFEDLVMKKTLHETEMDLSVIIPAIFFELEYLKYTAS